jgi:hypothetical protein
MHKLAHFIYRVVKSGQPFDVSLLAAMLTFKTVTGPHFLSALFSCTCGTLVLEDELVSLWTYNKSFEPLRLGGRHFVETDKAVGEQAESNIMVKKMGGGAFIVIALKSI